MAETRLAAGVRWLLDLARAGRTEVQPRPELLVDMAAAIDRDIAIRRQLEANGAPMVTHLGVTRPMMAPEMTDVEVATEARMLTHSELTPAALLAGGKPLDYYCVLVRDRILSLSQRLATMAFRFDVRVTELREVNNRLVVSLDNAATALEAAAEHFVSDEDQKHALRQAAESARERRP